MIPAFFKRLLRIQDENRTRHGFAAVNCPSLFLHGQGSYGFDVIGAVLHQVELKDIFTGTLRTGNRQACVAGLIFDEGKGDERPVVAVTIGHRVVGSCPAFLTTQIREWLLQWKLSDARMRCNAMIVVGKEIDRDGNLGLGVKLDIELPFKMTTA